MSSKHGLPTFLRPSERVVSAGHDYSCINAIFAHQSPLSPVHALWWPCAEENRPAVVILFIPGNPGLLDFYVPFLSRLHAKDSSGRLAILAHPHIGHTPSLADSTELPVTDNLSFQIKNATEAFDALMDSFPSAQIIVVGHSVGAWIALQIIKAQKESAGAFLLFPTISHIARTPNGRLLSWLFRYPMSDLITLLSRLAVLLPPSLLAQLFPSWPVPQLLILQSFIRSPTAVYASLCMADDEMKNIRDLDIPWHRKKHRLWMYFAEKDEWVGEQREVILQAFSAYTNNVEIVHGESDIPHAFCINHGEQLAAQCFNWVHPLLIESCLEL